MSFNSKAYLDYEERMLDPEYQLRGSQRRWPELRKPVPVLKQYPELSEYERNKRDDEWIEANYKTELP